MVWSGATREKKPSYIAFLVPFSRSAKRWAMAWKGMEPRSGFTGRGAIAAARRGSGPGAKFFRDANKREKSVEFFGSGDCTSHDLCGVVYKGKSNDPQFQLTSHQQHLPTSPTSMVIYFFLKVFCFCVLVESTCHLAIHYGLYLFACTRVFSHPHRHTCACVDASPSCRPVPYACSAGTPPPRHAFCG
jgi:hypothetical protein